MTIVNFTPGSGLAGGLFIGVSAALLLSLNGRLAGISGILGSAMSGLNRDTLWRWLFLAGLLLGATVEFWVAPGVRTFNSASSWPTLLLAGLLVGYGTRLGNGCTSGHGICGLARLSARSTVAVVTFMLSGAVTTFIVRHIVGGGA